MSNSPEELPDLNDEGFVAPGQEPEFVSTESVLTEDEEIQFVAALEIGHFEKEVTVMTHRVRIGTLTVSEELQLALLVKNWEKSAGEGRAYRAAVCAASIREINGQPLVQSIRQGDEDTQVSRAFEKIKEYYPVFLDAVYEEILKLEQEMFAELRGRLGKSPD